MRFDHNTGRGHVKHRRGAYHNALHEKGHEMVLLVSSVFGCVTERALKYLNALAARAAMDKMNDATEYDTNRPVLLTYFQHHARAISWAAIAGDADVMLKVVAAAEARAKAAVQAREAAGDHGALAALVRGQARAPAAWPLDRPHQMPTIAEEPEEGEVAEAEARVAATAIASGAWVRASSE